MVMVSKKSLKRDLRGGRRENAGRKPIWNNKDTITIRVPKFIVTQVMEIAHRLDSGENIDLSTKSKFANDDLVIKSNPPNYETIIKSKFEEPEIITQFNQAESRSKK